MKEKLWVVILLVCSLSVELSAANYTVLFSRANQLYEAKKYQKALEIYQAIEKSEVRSSNLYLNIANSEAHLGDYGTALLYYEKAKKVSRSSENIDMAISAIVSSRNLEYEFTRWSVGGFIAKQMSAQTWKNCCIAISVMISLVLVISFFKRSWLSKKSIAMLILSYLLLMLAGNYFLISNQQLANQQHWAIIVRDKALLKSTPSNSSTTNYEVVAGSKFEIKDHIGSWYLLQNQFGKRGWVEKINLGII